MKIKTLVTLYAIVLLLAAGVAVAKFIQNKEESTATRFERGYKPFSDLSSGEIEEIDLKGADQTATIKIIDGKWVVANRENYPANVQNLQNLIRTINDITVAQSLEAGESFNPRFGMDSSSSDPAMHGTTVTLKKVDGSVITRLQLGKEVKSNENEDPMAAMMSGGGGGGGGASGRFIRLSDDPESVYVINDAMTEAQSNPAEWLVSDFIKIANITSISLSPAGKLDEVAWSVTRPNSTGTFTLDGDVQAGKEIDATALSALNNVFGYANFEDVVSAKAAEGLMNTSQTQRALITTADGFRYQLDITPKGAAGTKNYLMTVSVSADIVKERTKPEGEDSDIAKQADADYAKKVKVGEEKLAFEKSLEGRIFEVTEFTVQPLMKKREEFYAVKVPPISTTPTNNYNQPRVTSPPVMFPGTGQ